jgi:hypothetical protein
MRTKHATKFLLAASLVVVSLTAGCASDPSGTGASGPETSKPTTTPTQTQSEEEQAVVAAEEAYREWRRVRASCLRNPASTLSSCFDEVAIGNQLTADYSSLDHFQREGWHVVGDVKIVSIELVSVDLTDRVDRLADPEQGIPEVRTVPKVVFNVCSDAGEYDLVDAAGESHLGPNFSRFRRVSVEMANYGYPDPAQWRVWDAETNSEKVTSCEP